VNLRPAHFTVACYQAGTGIAPVRRGSLTIINHRAMTAMAERLRLVARGKRRRNTHGQSGSVF
jgi:hypothetical protein